MTPPWIKASSGNSLLQLYIQPGASKTEVVGEHDERLKIKIKAPPRDGEANEELIRFMADLLGVSKSKVHLIKGESSRQKDLLIELSPEKIINSFLA